MNECFLSEDEANRREAAWLRRYHRKQFISIHWPLAAWVVVMGLMIYFEFQH